MTGKRFTLFEDGETIIDNESVADDGGKEVYWTVEYVQVVKLVKLLNELHEENKEQKRAMRIAEHYNEQLENEIIHIKTTIKTMMENERTELGRSVLKQLWSAIQ